MIQTWRKQFSWRWLTWKPAVTFTVVFFIYLIVSLLRLDPDFGWHLRAGEYFLAHGIPLHDIFSYTASNFPWVDHEWLSDVAVASVFSAVGYAGLCALYSALWTLSVWLVGRKAHNLLILLAVIATIPFAGFRAITWSLLGLALLISSSGSKNRKFRWFIPLLFLAWANIHGSFVYGFAYGIYMSIKERNYKLFLLILIGFVLTFINPYGVNLYVEVMRTMTDTSLHWQISEWRYLDIPFMTIPFVIAWMAGFALDGLKKWKNYLGFDVLAFLASISSSRNLVLFITVALAVTDERLRMVARKIPKQLDKPRRRFIVIVGAAFFVATIGTVVYGYWNFSIDPEDYYPRAEVAYLEKDPCTGNLFNDYGYGGYLIWKLPGQKVYIDGRMASWSHGGQKYLDDYFNVLKDEKARKSQFRKYNIQCVLISEGSASNKTIIKDLKKEGWKAPIRDNGGILLIKSQEP